MPKITILMPVYNGERYLRETIDNVLNQTCEDFLFLIINDGSTDGSEAIIKSYDDCRIVYHRNEKNLGLVATLNKGIDLVQTKYLARMDADDLWEPAKLEKQIVLMEQRPDVGLCGTSIHKFGAINGDFIFPVDNNHLKVGFLFYCMMSHPSVVYRMSFLRNTGLRYKANFFPAEDYKMWIDALDLTQIYNIPEVLVYYRQHESQITQDTNFLQLKKAHQVREEMLKRIYPSVSADELQFYQSVFADLNFQSVADYKDSKKFEKKLLRVNKDINYVNTDILKKELDRYLQIGYKAYILKTRFPEKKIKNFTGYLFSFQWVYLSPKRNARIFIDCLKK